MDRHPMAILDTSRLPLSKANMKLVFKIAWLDETDTRKRNVIELGYTQLSQFQDGVGDKPLDRMLPADADAKKSLAILDAYLKFSDASTKEAEILLMEFRDFKRGALT
jgi:hypothetical protein